MSQSSREYTDHYNANLNDFPYVSHVHVQLNDTEKLLQAIKTINEHGMVVMSTELYKQLNKQNLA